MEKRLFIERYLKKDKSIFNPNNIDYLGKNAGYIKVLLEEMIYYNACVESQLYSKKFTNYVHIYFYHTDKISYLERKNKEIEHLISLV